MNRFSFVVAAALGALSSLAAAQPSRGRTHHQASQPREAEDDDDSRSSSIDEDGAEAKGVAVFKLDDLVSVMVRQSPNIVKGRLTRDEARGNAGAARHDQSWVLGAQASYEREAIGAGTPVDQLTPLQVLAQDQMSGSVSLARKLPTGGQIKAEGIIQHTVKELNVPLQLLKQQSDMSNSGMPDIFYENHAVAKLTLSQPLLRGFGPDVALAGEHKADLGAAEATLKAQIAAEDTIKDMEMAYWELAYANFAVDVAAQALEFVKKQDELTRQEMRAGTSPANAGNAVAYQMAIRDEALITAKLDLEKKSLDLRRLAGLEIGRRDIVLKPGDPFEAGDEEFTVEGVLGKSRKANRRLAALTLEKKIADVDVDVTHNGMLPQVDLNLSGGLQGTGDTSSASFNGLSSGDGYTIMAGLTVSVELSGAARAANEAARAHRRSVDVERADQERIIDAQVVSATKAVISGRTRIALAEKAISIAEENLKAERASFLAQRTTNFAVMGRQGELVDAQLKRGRAIAEYHEAITQLRYLTGTLLEHYHLDVHPHEGE